MWLTKLVRGFENWALPPVCALCSDPGAAPGFDLCAACEAELPAAADTWCAPHADPTGQPPPPAPLAGLDALWSAFDYEFPVDAMIRELKFGGQVHYARILGLACLRRMRCASRPWASVDTILPVPLHRDRLSERGFNQAREIAVPIARGLGLPLVQDRVWRQRATAPQTLLAADTRRRNLQDAFAVRRPVQGLSLLLMDDVTTTGTTLAELARVLKAAGARRVSAITVASATGHGSA
ncbi:MAG: ComF family protein [Proteobacteria bacterium]|nr:ComF family protein [Pseudomonadota bacterium]